MDFIIAVIIVVVVIMAFRPKKSSRPSKKFGDGLFTDTDSSNSTDTKS